MQVLTRSLMWIVCFFSVVADYGHSRPKSQTSNSGVGPAGDPGATVTNQMPDDWEMSTTKKGDGTLFKDPENPSGNNVRVQSGNPDSPNPGQQNPYVKQMSNGKQVDVNGKQVGSDTQESHIPRDQFKFIKK